MTRIGLISDTHGYLDENVFKHFENCDEIWHAGDFGNRELADQLSAHWSDGDGQTKVRGVYGNIDSNDIRTVYPEQLVFTCEKVKVMRYFFFFAGGKIHYVQINIAIFIAGVDHFFAIR